jgi:hypothetical protein
VRASTSVVHTCMHAEEGKMIMTQEPKGVPDIPKPPPPPPPPQQDIVQHCAAGNVHCKRARGQHCKQDNGKLINVNGCEVCPIPSQQQLAGNEKVGQRTISIAQCAQHPDSMPILFTRGEDIVVGPYCGQCLDTQLGAVLTKLTVTNCD